MNFCLVILTLISVEFNYFEGRCHFFFWRGGGLDLKGVDNYLNSLIKLLVCGADDIIFSLDLCLCLFVLLDSFFYFFWLILFVWEYVFYYE